MESKSLSWVFLALTLTVTLFVSLGSARTAESPSLPIALFAKERYGTDFYGGILNSNASYEMAVKIGLEGLSESRLRCVDNNKRIIYFLSDLSLVAFTVMDDPVVTGDVTGVYSLSPVGFPPIVAMELDSLTGVVYLVWIEWTWVIDHHHGFPAYSYVVSSFDPESLTFNHIYSTPQSHVNPPQNDSLFFASVFEPKSRTLYLLSKFSVPTPGDDVPSAQLLGIDVDGGTLAVSSFLSSTNSLINCHEWVWSEVSGGIYTICEGEQDMYPPTLGLVDPTSEPEPGLTHIGNGLRFDPYNYVSFERFIVDSQKEVGYLMASDQSSELDFYFVEISLSVGSVQSIVHSYQTEYDLIWIASAPWLGED